MIYRVRIIKVVFYKENRNKMGIQIHFIAVFLFAFPGTHLWRVFLIAS